MNVVYSPLALERLTEMWERGSPDNQEGIRAAARVVEADLLRQATAGRPVATGVFLMVRPPLAVYYERKGNSIRVLDLRTSHQPSVNGQTPDEHAVDVRRPDPEPLLWYPTEWALRIAAREWNDNEPPLPTDAELRQDLAGPRYTIDEVLAGFKVDRCG